MSLDLDKIVALMKQFAHASEVCNDLLQYAPDLTPEQIGAFAQAEALREEATRGILALLDDHNDLTPTYDC